jgi:hypothetical protein
MGSQNHPILNNHGTGFNPRIEQQRVLPGIGEIRGGAPDDAAVIRFEPVRPYG